MTATGTGAARILDYFLWEFFFLQSDGLSTHMKFRMRLFYPHVEVLILEDTWVQTDHPSARENRF